VDELTLVLMSIFIPGQPLAVKYNYAAFIADKIHDQFMRLENEKVFKYSTFIYHLILYYQSDRFPFFVNKIDTKGNPRSVIFWTSIFHQSFACPYTYNEFIDQFVHPVTTMLTGNPPSRIGDEIKSILQLSKQYRVGDWYLYQNHTKIKIYGCELPPFKLPKYVPLRLFALEYYRQMINSYQIHFTKAKKKAHLKIKDHLGPFICNNREAGKVAEAILESHMKLNKIFGWKYDPHSFIYDRRMKNRLSPYFHHRIPEIEQYENMDEWRE